MIFMGSEEPHGSCSKALNSLLVIHNLGRECKCMQQCVQVG